MRAQLIVSVDTEEEGRWGGGFPTHKNTTENLLGLPRFQDACESLGVPPTYLIDAPVLENPVAIEQLRSWWDHNRCEVGTHCHPWCNPPISEEPPTPEASYLCNLPPEVQYQKLAWLTKRIADRFERRPLSYRAGRYGFDKTSADILSELGYRVDSSVLPMHDYRHQGGPDFRMSSPAPAAFSESQDGLVELPITAGFTRGHYETQRDRWIQLRNRPWIKFRLAGIADRLGLVRCLKLSPEGTNLQDLKKLVDQSIADSRTTLVLMLHSSSLMPGFSPYAKDAAMLEALYRRLTGIIDYAIQRHGAIPATLSDAADALFSRPHMNHKQTKQAASIE